MRKVQIYWLTQDKPKKRLICDKFKIRNETSVNGETETKISDDDWDLFVETARRGFFVIRKMEIKK